MKKRGQITIFLVLVAVIVLTLEMAYYINSLDKPDIEDVIGKKPEADIVRAYAESCLGMIGKDALFNSGLQGGYIDAAKIQLPTASFSGNNVPVYIELKGFTAEGKPIYNEHYPDLSAISEKLATHILAEFENCLNADVFESMGINIEKPGIDYQAIGLSKKNVDIDVGINKEDVSIKLMYPLDIKASETRTKLDSFRVSLPIRLRALYESSIAMVKNMEKAPGIYNIAQDCSAYDKNNLTDVYLKNSIDPEIKIVQFADSSTYEKKYFKPYIFQFAVRKVGINGECNKIEDK